MTVTEAVAHFGVSRSTIYRRIKRGQLSAHKKGRSWIIDLEERPIANKETVQDWHPQIHRRFAEQDGRVPSDFTWLNYPISDVSLALPHSIHQTFIYRALISSETPQVNQYFTADEREPDKQYQEVDFGGEVWYALLVRGTALSRVKFSLIDLADGEVLHESAAGHIDGVVEAGMGKGPKAREAFLWKRLVPGTTLRVRLEALPLFYPYNNPETGSGGTEYSLVNNGYLGGDVVFSKEYELTLTPNGLPEPTHLLLDGEPAPELPAQPENPEDVASRLEGDRIMAEEKAQQEAAIEAARKEAEEENRLYNERMEREAAEQQAEQERLRQEADEQRERERQEYEAEKERARKEREKLGDTTYTEKDQMIDYYRNNFEGTPNAEAKFVEMLRKVYGLNSDWKRAVDEIVAEMGLTF